MKHLTRRDGLWCVDYGGMFYVVGPSLRDALAIRRLVRRRLAAALVAQGAGK